MQPHEDGSGSGVAALRASTLCEVFQVTATERPQQVALRTLGGRDLEGLAERARANCRNPGARSILV